MAKKITYQRLHRITLHYLSRYEASTEKVRQMLKKRVDTVARLGQEIPSETNQWIEQIVAKVVKLGYVDDKRYGENQVRTLSAMGKSKRFMVAKLTLAGLDPDEIERLLVDSDKDEVSRAQIFIRRKKIGWMRAQECQKDYRQKDLATLGRAGFSYETAVQALKTPEDF